MRSLLFLLPLAAAASTGKRPCCSTLARSLDLSEHNAKITKTKRFAAGERDVGGTLNEIPFCEVSASVSYGDNDTLRFALWLPDAESYSSRFMAVGNGGYAGEIIYPDMMADLNSGLGFAVAGGDAGHRASDNDVGAGPGLGAPGKFMEFLHDEDQVEAWLHDGISLMTPAAKAIMKGYYGKKPSRSYFRGCSSGGGQGFGLAQFHPGLFDGIIAGGSCNWFSHVILAFLWNAQHAGSSETTLPQSILDLIQASVLEACDLNDGVKDNLVENPLSCDFDVASLGCESDDRADNTTCLSAAQVSTVQAIHQGPVRSDTEKAIYPGIALGSEGGWTLPTVVGALSNAFSIPMLQNMVFDDLSWDPTTFNWASDIDLVDAELGPLIDAVRTDLSTFRSRGGKMIVYAGWADPNISPLWSMQHVDAVTRATLGEETTIAENDFLKLVMIPGGGHCDAELDTYPYIPSRHGFSGAMVGWVEDGREPSEGIKSWGPRNGDDRTRRLCTWPRTARLKAGGDVDDWESYVCA